MVGLLGEMMVLMLPRTMSREIVRVSEQYSGN